MAALSIAPLLLIAAYSVLTRGRFGGVERPVNLDSYARLAEPTFFNVLVDSVQVASLATLLGLVIGFPTAYVIAALPPKWRSIALLAVVLPFWTNFLIRTYAWIVLLNTAGPVNRGLVNLGLLAEPWTILYTKPAVVIGLLYAYLPLMILPIYASLRGLDPELGEGATDLGAQPLRVLRDIHIPLAMPGIITGSIFVFVPSLGNFVVPELLGGGKTILLGNLLRDQFLKARDWPFGSVLAMTMVAILVALFLVQATVSRRVSEGVRR